MKSKLVEQPPTGGNWSYELKFDGIRALTIKTRDKISFLSRNHNELGKRFPEIVEAMAALPADDFVVDGEVVALDEKGRSSFQLLQSLEMEGRKAPVCYYAFDLVQAAGKSLALLPLEQRKALLAKLVEGLSDPIRYSGEIGAEATPLLDQVRRLGLEGIIGKQRGSVYEAGRRSGAWIKLKCLNEQEFVIGGYTEPAGARKYFGALLVGYYGDKKKKDLHFAGRVGTGFTEESLGRLYKQFQRARQRDCPFVDLPAKHHGRWNQGITPAEMRNCTWLNPVFVAQVKFAEWTADGSLRQPVFLGLRDDKNARDVGRAG